MFHALPHALYTPHVGESSSGLSPRLWSRMHESAMAPDGASRLVLIGDDFLSFGGLVTTTAGDLSSEGGSYKSYQDTGGTILQRVDAKGGVVRFTTDTTDNDENWLQSGYTAGVLGAISDTAADAHMTAFEARVRVSSIADTITNMFVGLAEEGLAAADTMADSGGDMADKDYIGFQIIETDGDSIDFVYQKEGQTGVTLISGVQVPVASTWYKLGFLYDPNAPTARRITVYVDNTEQSTYVTGTQIGTATFPDGEELSFLMGGKNAAGTAQWMEIDWWAFGQLIT